MKVISLVVGVALLGLTGCNDSAAPKKSGKTTGETGPGDYLNNLGAAKQQAVKTVDTTAVNKAIEQFYVEEGRFPKDLLQLVEMGYLPRLPELPAGTNWNYDTNTGVVSITKPSPQ